MTYPEFVRKYNGHYVEADYSGRPGTKYQCVDLVNQYIKEVLKKNPIGGNAIDFDRNFNPADFIYYRNTASFVPKSGDIAIFGRLVGTYGHVDIVYVDPYWPANVRNFCSFSQNWGKGTPAHLIRHNMYYGVKGFLRKK